MAKQQIKADLGWKDVEPMFRPSGVHMGVMQCNVELCTQCGLCIQNCPFKAWEAGDDKVPRLKKDYACFSCYNCMVACPTGAISIVEPYVVDKGSFYETADGPLPPRMPLDPKDAEGQPDAWTDVERHIFERRSVRNFKARPVPDHLIRRILEAGRYAPSAGNCQPWKFIVITDTQFIAAINEATHQIIETAYTAYMDEEGVKSLVQRYAQDPKPGSYDPRLVFGGYGSIAKGAIPAFLNAPVLILIVCDERSVSTPEIHAGICGQNMNLAAKALGLGFCWIGWSRVVEMVPTFKEKLGLHYPWKIITGAVLGYPRFKQEGVVPREFRPVTWFRPGADGYEIEGG